jgi:hypothetical protein
MIIESYAGVPEANLYVAYAYGPQYTYWLTATELVQNQVLIQATRMMERLPFAGMKKTINQPLFFPRTDDLTIPEDIVSANIELAVTLYSEGRNAQMDYEEIPVSSQGYGKARESRDTTIELPHILAGIPSLEAWRLMLPYIDRDKTIYMTRA